MIKDFFREEDVEGVSLIIFNALFFSLKWCDPFDPDLTEKDHKFLSYSSKRSSTVDMMMKPGTHVNVKQVEGAFTMFELKFKDQDMAVTFLKPDMKMERFEENYDVPDEVRKFADGEGVQMKKANVGVPKMVITHKEKLSKKVKEILELDKMFQPGDIKEKRFGGITKEDLFVSEIMQAGTIEVNETGVKVAVVTATTMCTTSAGVPVY